MWTTWVINILDNSGNVERVGKVMVIVKPSSNEPVTLDFSFHFLSVYLFSKVERIWIQPMDISLYRKLILFFKKYQVSHNLICIFLKENWLLAIKNRLRKKLWKCLFKNVIYVLKTKK